MRHNSIMLNDGDSVLLEKHTKVWYMGCCDCELTHRIDVKATAGGYLLTFNRDDRRTSQRRRRRKAREQR